MNKTDDLDTSWIKDHEKMSNINDNYFREPMEFISLNFIYVNTENEIVKVVSDEEDLVSLQPCEEGKSEMAGISKERLLHIIQSRRNIDHIHYKILDILSYVVDLESDKIQCFSKMDDASCGELFLKNVSIIASDISIAESIFIFHEINAIYFLFKESPLKSILKNPASNRSTKKVRISGDVVPEKCVDLSTIKKRFTRYLHRKLMNEKGATRKNNIGLVMR